MTNYANRIAALEAMTIVGNAFHDQPLFNAANEIIMDDTDTMFNRIRAMKMIDKAMGCTDYRTSENPHAQYDEPDESAVLQYVADCS